MAPSLTANKRLGLDARQRESEMSEMAAICERAADRS
jgi:hypothetical protein